MEYFIEDYSGYCLERNLPTLTLAKACATEHPSAVRIVEYKDAGTRPRGFVPTGRVWGIEQAGSEPPLTVEGE